MKHKIESGSTIAGVETAANGIIIKLLDNKTYPITNGTDGKYGF